MYEIGSGAFTSEICITTRRTYDVFLRLCQNARVIRVHAVCVTKPHITRLLERCTLQKSHMLGEADISSKLFIAESVFL